jgi:hypothetical protein
MAVAARLRSAGARLVVGPAAMAVIVLLWRDLVAPADEAAS